MDSDAIIAIAAVIQLVILLVFLVMAANVGKIRQLLEKPVTLRRQCPHCLETMRRDAAVCPHCQRESDPWQLRDGHWWSTRDGRSYRYNEQNGEWVEASSSAEAQP
ncbi:MAG TPA: hypothetical protein VF058_00240 [Actinomycetota bacterium]